MFDTSCLADFGKLYLLEQITLVDPVFHIALHFDREFLRLGLMGSGIGSFDDDAAQERPHQMFAILMPHSFVLARRLAWVRPKCRRWKQDEVWLFLEDSNISK